MKKGQPCRLLDDSGKYDNLPDGTIQRVGKEWVEVQIPGEAKARRIKDKEAVMVLDPTPSPAKVDVAYSDVLMRLDGKPIKVTKRLHAALSELGLALLDQGKVSDEQFPNAWAWCRITLGDLGAEDLIREIRFGAREQMPDDMGMVGVLGV